MTPKQQLLEKVSLQPKFGAGICLHRVGLAIDQIIPRDYFEQTAKIVVTGTDGKGSTSMLINAILQANGVKTGLFTSPHFLDFNERFVFNGEKIEYPQLNQAMDRVLDKTSAIAHELNETFGVFEILFLLALDVFYHNNADVLIFEAGIGGRYDPVRQLKPKLTALTSVALEHTALLGDSKELIAYDKLDACYPGGQTVVGLVEPSLSSKINAYASLKDIEVIDSTSVRPMAIDSHRNAAPMCFNIQTAIAVCRAHFGDKLPSDFTEVSKEAIKHCQIPGRFEKISTAPELYIDCAHTPNAFKLLFGAIKAQFADKSVIFVVGTSQGRDTQILVEGVLKLASAIIVTQANFKGADAQALFDQFNQATEQKQLKCEPDLKAALDVAKTMATTLDARVFVVGGLFLAGETAAIEQGMETQDLYLY